MRKYFKYLLVIISSFLIISFYIKEKKLNLDLVPLDQVDNISFYVNDNQYDLKKEKYEILLNELDQLDIISREKINAVSYFLPSIVIESGNDERIFVDESGNLIKERENEYFLYEIDGSEIGEIIKTVLGEFVYMGVVIPSEEWIEPSNGYYLFDIDVNQIENIIIDLKGYHLIKQEKIYDFISELNKVTYSSIEDYYVIGKPNRILLYFEDQVFECNVYAYDSSDSEDIKLYFKINVGMDYYGAPLFQYNFSVNDLRFFEVFKEMMGDDSIASGNLNVDPSPQWVEKSLDEEEFILFKNKK